jgi:hypothetical protein
LCIWLVVTLQFLGGFLLILKEGKNLLKFVGVYSTIQEFSVYRFIRLGADLLATPCLISFRFVALICFV